MATADLQAGVQYMAVFGLGTVPMMLAISLGGAMMPVAWRVKLRQTVPVAVALLAGLLILRGLSLGIPYLSPELSVSRPGLCCH
jgi:sulfite exporter TauE/SafE